MFIHLNSERGSGGFVRIGCVFNFFRVGTVGLLQSFHLRRESVHLLLQIITLGSESVHLSSECFPEPPERRQ